MPHNIFRSALQGCVLLVVTLLLLTGCATTPPIDWGSRVGVYSYDQAIIDHGPPDKMAKLSDGGTVAEWKTGTGRVFTNPVPMGYYGGPNGRYGPYPSYLVTPQVMERSPDTYLRLIFDPKGMLVNWTDFSR